MSNVPARSKSTSALDEPYTPCPHLTEFGTQAPRVASSRERCPSVRFRFPARGSPPPFSTRRTATQGLRISDCALAATHGELPPAAVHTRLPPPPQKSTAANYQQRCCALTLRPRLERGTPSLEGSCSIQLSYRSMKNGDRIVARVPLTGKLYFGQYRETSGSCTANRAARSSGSASR